MASKLGVLQNSWQLVQECLYYTLFCYTYILQKAAFLDGSCLATEVVKFNIAVPAGKSVVRLTRCTGEGSCYIFFVHNYRGV